MDGLRLRLATVLLFPGMGWSGRITCDNEDIYEFGSKNQQFTKMLIAKTANSQRRQTGAIQFKRLIPQETPAERRNNNETKFGDFTAQGDRIDHEIQYFKIETKPSVNGEPAKPNPRKFSAPGRRRILDPDRDNAEKRWGDYGAQGDRLDKESIYFKVEKRVYPNKVFLPKNK